MKIILLGRKNYLAELLRWTLEQGVQIAGIVTDSHLLDSPTTKRAKELSIPILEIEDVEKILSKKDHGIDLIVSYLFWKKIKEPLISSPKFGCINLHPAILPNWRGAAGYNIAILNKFEEWGATAHYVAKEIDLGDIIRVFKFNFDYRLETAFSLEKKTQEIQMQLFKNIILDVKDKGKLKSTPQSLEDGHYISKKEMIKMSKIDVINDDIDLKISAFWFPPYHGAYVEINNIKYTLVNDFILKQLADKNSTNNLNIPIR